MPSRESLSDGEFTFEMPAAVPTDRGNDKDKKGFFSRIEEQIYERWRRENTFKEQLKLTMNKPAYNFYDGPPFATGLPHYGHILAGSIKDCVTRYKAMDGYHVERRFGWDCHGLPIEHEIDKKYQISGPEAVKEMGIRAYNDKCRDIVSTFAAEWERQVGRLARWVDFEHDYKTMYPEFMESVWWVFKQLYDKGLVYAGYKVMPYSTACTTPLSNFEVGQNYQEVDDPAVVVTLPLLDDPSVSLCVWTTTPWTLPSHQAACVHPDKDYAKVRDNKTQTVYIVMEARLAQLYKKPKDYTVLEKFKGITLKGLRYKPPFDYFASRAERGAFRVVCDEYVTEDAGTGIVHQAPYFGEDDFRVCMREGIIDVRSPPVCPVDDAGRFTSEVTHFAGQHVKDADKNIINHLKAAGRLVRNERVRHQYPFCWRSNTPLIYMARPSWFVRVEEYRDKLVTNTEKTYWVPEYARTRRFGNWLRDARDWCIGRNRYWGTPIPLWTNEDRTEWVCIGSVEELKRRSGRNDITDLHRDYIDDVTIPSADGKTQLRRVKEVFDCWFESGSMPYAQQHFPFENKEYFLAHFPADFIAEGIDQTRGWFYTLMVISTLLFDKPPFKNVVVNGLVLAADGQKMSKSKKNYPDPMLIVDEFGADPLRLYLINSPVVRGENFRFQNSGVRDTLKDVILPWYNAYRFFIQNAIRHEQETGARFMATLMPSPASNEMDRWIVSYTNSLVRDVRFEMKKYNLSGVVPRLLHYIELLTNWYVRMNRRRLKCEGTSVADSVQALHTLYYVHMTLVRLMAPFTPYLSEYMYLNLRHALPESQRRNSVHHADIPHCIESLIDRAVESRVAAMQAVVDTARAVRDREGIGLKYPLRELIVIVSSEATCEEVKSMAAYIKEEVNVREVRVSTDQAAYGVQLKADLNYKQLGEKLSPQERKEYMQQFAKAVKAMSTEELQKFARERKMTLHGFELDDTDVLLSYAISNAGDSNHKAHSDGTYVCVLDISVDDAMRAEGQRREIINRMQKQRKIAKLHVHDVYCRVQPPNAFLAQVLRESVEEIENATRQRVHIDTVPPLSARILEESSHEIRSGANDSATLHLILVDTRTQELANGFDDGETPADADADSVVTVQYEKRTVKIPLRLKNGTRMTLEHLRREIRAAFDLHTRALKLHGKNGWLKQKDFDDDSLHGGSVTVHLI